MSSIKIQKIGITEADVDCVVNAANSMLQEGGGVCGAIFAKAGAHELQKACDAFGGCKEGSAVITPGFKLKSKYIIHAVGPRWNGGSYGEEEKLYSCYQASMKLAQKNDCHTIAFPLISSGIFGYPQKAAWEVALRSVRDYQIAHEEYQLDVLFSVLADDMLKMGEAALSSITQSEKTAKAEGIHIVRFHLPDEENGYMSNWYLRDMVIGGKTYCCVEQYMMEQKAILFNDPVIADQIMQTCNQQEMQDLGRAVKNFDPVIWDGYKQLIVYTGLLAKFEQNQDLLGQLLLTNTATPVECSRSDKIWGIGMSINDPNVVNRQMWKGKNLLGFSLAAVRSEMMRRVQIK